MEPAHCPGGLGLVISDLERAAIGACAAFHEGQIGEGLRRFSVAARHGGPDEAPSDQLVMYEVNSGAPVARTLRTLQMMEMSGTPVDTSGAEQFLEWIPRAVAAIQRLAQMCWQPIPKRERKLVFDEDDLGPAASAYLPATREDQLGPSLVEFEGLAGSDALESWKELSRWARQTEAYAAAKEAGEALQNPALNRELVACREGCSQRLREVLEGPPITLGDTLDKQKDLIRGAYDGASADLRQAAIAIRGYSELVNHLLWAVLCAADSGEGLQTLEGDLGAARVSGSDVRPQHLSVVMDDRVWIGNPPAPFVIEQGLPVDGLYVLQASMFQFEQTGLVDIQGARLASLERPSV